MSRGSCLGIDTSNYTTSAAVFDGEDGRNLSRLLDVPPGGLGLRQSEALFQHVKRLPALFRTLRQEGLLEGIAAVGASVKPRRAEGSYMPCFLAGEGQGKTLADALGVPFFSFSHQEGHLAAAAWGAGRIELLDAPMLAWHLSGGTTELLLVRPEGTGIRAKKLGGTQDLSAGQLIDRTGVLLGLDFPAGRALDELAREAQREDFFPVKQNGLTFSLSGMENKVKELAERGEERAVIARFVLHTLSDIILRVTQTALAQEGTLPVLCSGGVASNSILRERLKGALFAQSAYSTDNAMGPAILAYRALTGGETGE